MFTLAFELFRTSYEIEHVKFHQITICLKDCISWIDFYYVFYSRVIAIFWLQCHIYRHNMQYTNTIMWIQWNPSKPELLKTGNPSKLNDFVSPEFLSSYLIYPSKPKTPLNQTFSLIRRVFGLEGLHCTVNNKTKNNMQAKNLSIFC